MSVYKTRKVTNMVKSELHHGHRPIGEQLSTYGRISELRHHGILGMKWGVRNGPPYPLSGGDYTKSEMYYMSKNARDKKLRSEDRVLAKGTTMQTLSVDKDRLKSADMYYAAWTPKDKQKYMHLFNKAMAQPVYDNNGIPIGQKKLRKYNLETVAPMDIKIAGENASSDVFKKLYSEDRDFYNYVTDPSRMEALFVKDKYKFKGYREARDILHECREGKTPSGSDLQVIYRMYNYTIPNVDKDTIKQRKKFFNELSKSGYSGILDTNDALYGGYKAEHPVIVFDMNKMIQKDAYRTKTKDLVKTDINVMLENLRR